MNSLLKSYTPGFSVQLMVIRNNLGLSRKEFGKEIGLSYACIRRYEDQFMPDACLPKEDNWKKIDNFLNRINYFKDDGKSFKENFKTGVVKYKSFWQPVKTWKEIAKEKSLHKKI